MIEKSQRRQWVDRVDQFDLLLVQVVGFVVILLAVQTAAVASKPSNVEKQRALASLSFGDTRATVYKKVSEDSRIQFVNPNIIGAMGMGSSSPGQPGPSSLFLFNFKDQRLRLIFEFCAGEELCEVELRGTSYDPTRERAELQVQYQTLRSHVESRYGPPSDTQSFEFEEIVDQSLPAWVHTWQRGDKRIVIRLGYKTRDRTRIQVGTVKSDESTRKPERRSHTVLRKTFRR